MSTQIEDAGERPVHLKQEAAYERKTTGCKFFRTSLIILKSVIFTLKSMEYLSRGFKQDMIIFAFQKEHFGFFCEGGLEGHFIYTAPDNLKPLTKGEMSNLN